MTGRTLKPSSLSLRPQRPSFSRTCSNSSCHSLRSQSQDQPEDTSIRPQDTNTSKIQEPADPNSTANSSRSRPIAIELPSRQRSITQFNTPTPPAPLSGRGEKLGGYFPFHEEVPKSYRAHPFHYDPSLDASLHSPMPRPDSPLFSGPTQHSAATSSTPVMDSIATMSPIVPPSGKYHPSNFKATAKTSNLTSTTTQGHSRQSSDVKRKIQQYQRDIMEQAARAAGMTMPGQNSPKRPKLEPLGSPGPVTPFELGESEGYLIAGLAGAGASQNQQDLIGRLIDQERARESDLTNPMRSPLRSPVVSPAS